MNFFTEDKKEWKELRNNFEKTVIFKNIKAIKNSLTLICLIVDLLLIGVYFNTKTIPYEIFIVASMLETIGQIILYKFTYDSLYKYTKTLNNK